MNLCVYIVAISHDRFLKLRAEVCEKVRDSRFPTFENSGLSVLFSPDKKGIFDSNEIR